jgi:hypothetical protein
LDFVEQLPGSWRTPGGLASGVENANEMADFPYLEAEDIVAALTRGDTFVEIT